CAEQQRDGFAPLVRLEDHRAAEDDILREEVIDRREVFRLGCCSKGLAPHQARSSSTWLQVPPRTTPYPCQSTGPAVGRTAASERPSAVCASSEVSISLVRSTPVETPISSSIETRSSVEMFPVEPGGTGQPPSSPKLLSNESIPCATAASTLARP